MIIIGNSCFITARIKIRLTPESIDVVRRGYNPVTIFSMPPGITIKTYSDWRMCFYDNDNQTVENNYLSDSLSSRIQLDPDQNCITNFRSYFWENLPYTLSCWFWADIDENIIFN